MIGNSLDCLLIYLFLIFFFKEPLLHGVFLWPCQIWGPLGSLAVDETLTERAVIPWLV